MLGLFVPATLKSNSIPLRNGIKRTVISLILPFVSGVILYYVGLILHTIGGLLIMPVIQIFDAFQF